MIATINEMVQLLEHHHEFEWAAKMQAALEASPDLARATLLQMFGGMGSLNDLVLQTDMSRIVVDNNRFDQLRTDLYSELQASH